VPLPSGARVSANDSFSTTSSGYRAAATRAVAGSKAARYQPRNIGLGSRARQSGCGSRAGFV
jgi:hypothetical protein